MTGDEMKDLVIYHANCFDGFCAAWLFHYYVPDAEFKPMQYGDDPPSLEGYRRVYVLDFSFNKESMKEMSSQCESVLVLDHHKTAREEIGDLDDFDGTGRLIVEFDIDRSGARMSWDFLNANHLLPDFLHTHYADTPHWLVLYTEDRDLWNHKLPDTKEINCAIRSMPFDFQQWDKIARDHQSKQNMILEGKAVLKYKTKLVDQQLPYAKEFSFCDGKYTAPALNCSVGDLQSEVAGKLSEENDFGAVWVDQGDGNQLWSLRSQKGKRDVSVIAKNYGGGGHASAAGFRCRLGDIKIV